MENTSDVVALVSIIIPAHNESALIGKVIAEILKQVSDTKLAKVEVIVVDDASTDDTLNIVKQLGVKVYSLSEAGKFGNPAAARNYGASKAQGDTLVFLDADCVPANGWLEAIITAHESGAKVVGGSIDLPEGLSTVARCDFYCGWYQIHPGFKKSRVPHHPPPNISVRKDIFLASSMFTEYEPFSYTNEERLWQSEVIESGYDIWFEPKARVYHYNRPGLINLMKRNYRWAYTALEAKSQTKSARLSWLYQHPYVLILLSVPLVFVHSFYILYCWGRVGNFEPLLLLPLVILSRISYMAGMTIGGLDWLLRRGKNV